MDRSTGTPIGFALLLLFVIAFGWVTLGAPGHAGTGADLAGFSPADLQSAQAKPVLDWPKDMPGPMTDYAGRRVNAFGLRVTSVDADEGFWVEKDGRRAWVQIQTATESPYTVRVGDTVSLSGQVLLHDPDFPSRVFFCPGRDASAKELADARAHLAVKVNALSFGTG